MVTAFADKLSADHHKSSTEYRLENLAKGLLKKKENKCEPTRCINKFVYEVTQGAELLILLMGETTSKAQITAVALNYLSKVAAGMLKINKSVDETEVGGVQSNGDQSQAAGGTTQSKPVHVSEHVRGMPGQVNAGDEVHGLHESQTAAGLIPAEDGGVQQSGESHKSSGPAIPNPSRMTAAVMRQVNTMTTSIFDTHKLMNGRSIGDICFDEIDQLIGTNVRDAMLLRQIRKHVVPADSHAKIRDVIKLDELQRMVQKSAEMADTWS